MVFDYAVKHNGIDYPAGADVPVGDVPQAGPGIEEYVKPEPQIEVKEDPKPQAKPKKRTAKK